MSSNATEKLLVLFFDRLPPRWVGGYGCDWLETPEFDAFMAEALVFDNAFLEKLGPDFEPWNDALLNRLEEAGVPVGQDELALADIAGSITAGEDDEPTAGEERVALLIEGMVDFFRDNSRRVYWLDVRAELEKLLADQLPQDREPANAAIAGLVGQADFFLGMIRETLRQNGWDDEVALILAAAEGVVLPDQKGGTPIGSVTHIPLILRCPGAAGGERRQQLCAESDLVGSISQIFMGEIAEPHLRPLFDSDRTEIREYLLQTNGRDIALRHPDWLFILECDGKMRLYQKPADRFEVNDLAGKFVDWCDAARQFIERAKHDAVRPPLPAELLEIRFAVDRGGE